MATGFKGVSAGQDIRFSDKERKLLKSMKFPKEFETKLDLRTVNWEVMKEWIAKRVTELLGVEDEVLIAYIFEQLEGKQAIDPRILQINLTGFLEKNTSLFVKELWGLLASACTTVSGIPQPILEAKAEEVRKKKEVQDQINERLAREKAKRQEEEREQRKHDEQARAARRAEREKADRAEADARRAARQAEAERQRVHEQERAAARERQRRDRYRDMDRDQAYHRDRAGPYDAGRAPYSERDRRDRPPGRFMDQRRDPDRDRGPGREPASGGRPGRDEWDARVSNDDRERNVAGPRSPQGDAARAIVSVAAQDLRDDNVEENGKRPEPMQLGEASLDKKEAKDKRKKAKAEKKKHKKEKKERKEKRRREGSMSSEGGSDLQGKPGELADVEMADAEAPTLDSLRQEALKRHQSK